MANLVRLPALEKLDLSRQRYLSNEGLRALQHLPLRRLDLRECELINNDGLMLYRAR